MENCYSWYICVVSFYSQNEFFFEGYPHCSGVDYKCARVHEYMMLIVLKFQELFLFLVSERQRQD